MNKLIYLRKLNNKTQSEIAKLINMSQSNYGKIERNEVNLTQQQVNLLANYYNVSISYLLDDNNTDITITLEQYKNLIKARNAINEIEKAYKKINNENTKNINNGIIEGPINAPVIIGDNNHIKD